MLLCTEERVTEENRLEVIFRFDLAMNLMNLVIRLREIIQLSGFDRI